MRNTGLRELNTHRTACHLAVRHTRFAIRAFTLIELMVVVVILGVLATAVTISVSDYFVTAKQNVAKSEIATMKNALTLYFMQHDRYPATDEGLGALKKKTPEHPDGILSSDLLDPWGNEYIYLYPGVHGAYDLLSLGADGQEGGEGANADLTSWEIGESE